jgi:hypothetical protein
MYVQTNHKVMGVNNLINGLKQSIAQTNEQVLEKYRIETNSKIARYNPRDHAWNMDQHDRTNFYDMRDDAPSGYKAHLVYEDPHPTNLPYLKAIKPEACVDKAQLLIA